jgi:hypothetical protein
MRGLRRKGKLVSQPRLRAAVCFNCIGGDHTAAYDVAQAREHMTKLTHIHKTV